MGDGRPERVEGVEVSAVADGYVVYDPAKDRVHYLNHTAAVVLEFCTGEHTVDEIARLLQVAYELPEPPAREAGECLAHLRQEGLIT